MNDLYHYGMPRRSGRYPWGSGDRPYQRNNISIPSNKIVEKSIKKRTDLAKYLGLNPDENEVKNKTSLNLDEKTYIKKGEKVQHITGVDIKELKKSQMYITSEKEDNKLYEAFLGANLKKLGYTPMKAILTLKEDLKAPSANEQYDIFRNMLEKDSKKIYDSLSKYLVDKKKFSSSEEALNDLKTRNIKDLYIEFTNSFEASGIAQGDFYKELKKRGYNAVLDEHDRLGSWMLGKKPLILMDALNTVGDMKIENISDSGLVKAMNEVLRKG